MWLGFFYYRDGHGAFTSPPVLQDHGYCYLTFYYILNHFGHASLSVFIEDNIGKKITTLWNAKASTYDWKKKVLELPTLSNYSVVFLGYIDRGGHYVIIDDIKFRHCNSCKFLCLFGLFNFLICYFLLKININSVFLLPMKVTIIVTNVYEINYILNPIILCELRWKRWE